MRRGCAEIGYWIAATARGHGVAARAVMLVRDWATGEPRPRAQRDRAPSPTATNGPSQRVAERAGFTDSGEIRAVSRMPPEKRDGPQASTAGVAPEPAPEPADVWRRQTRCWTDRRCCSCCCPTALERFALRERATGAAGGARRGRGRARAGRARWPSAARLLDRRPAGEAHAAARRAGRDRAVRRRSIDLARDRARAALSGRRAVGAGGASQCPRPRLGLRARRRRDE